MDESSDTNGGENVSSHNEDYAAGWLELLASKPDTIWDSQPASQDPVKGSSSEESRNKETAVDPTGLQPANQPSTVWDRAQSGRETGSVADRELTAEIAEAHRVEAQTLADIEEEGAEGATSPGSAAASEESSGEAKLSGHSEDGSSSVNREVTLEMDDLIWLDEMDEMPEMNMDYQEDDERQRANEVGEMSGGPEPRENHDMTPGSLLDSDSDQVPDDPDEAIAWLERLAARQGAPVEELPTMPSPVPDVADTPDAADGFDVGEMDAGEIPEDPDEAMAWLEMLAAKEGANSDEPTVERSSTEEETAAISEVEAIVVEEAAANQLAVELDEALEESLPSGLDEALGWLEELTVEPEATEDVTMAAEPMSVIEEPPTPAVAHDVAEALAGADLLFAEPESTDAPVETDQPLDEVQLDEGEDAMAWLEQLAARQGAPMEELTTVEVPSEELARETMESEPPSQVEVPLADTSSEVASDETDSIDGPDLAAIGSMSAEAVVDEQPADSDFPGEEVLPAEDEMEMAPDIDTRAADLAWLDTLGAVDAERWLEAEDAGLEEKFDAELQEAQAGTQREEGEPSLQERHTSFAATPVGPGSEALAEARKALEDGEYEESLSRYSRLVERGELLAFLIDDLEVISEQRGPDLGLQRVLGDAYARNGQLRKALESYREALANL